MGMGRLLETGMDSGIKGSMKSEIEVLMESGMEGGHGGLINEGRQF